jgi:hypothetical protein
VLLKEIVEGFCQQRLDGGVPIEGKLFELARDGGSEVSGHGFFSPAAGG